MQRDFVTGTWFDLVSNPIKGTLRNENAIGWPDLFFIYDFGVKLIF